MPRSDLFPELAVKSQSKPIHALRSKDGYSSSQEINGLVSDNLHNSSDAQIAKLVNLKFNSNAFALIRQLSQDLSAKETELILLREEKSRRENELLRLCNEFGNLSYVEVDRRLNALKPEKNVHKVVSAMVLDAMAISDSQGSNERLPKDVQRPKPQSRNKRTALRRTQQPFHKEEKSASTQNRKSLAEATDIRSSVGLPVSPNLHDTQNPKEEPIWPRWLHWLNQSEESVDLPNKSTDIQNKSSIENSRNKSVVELESMGDSFSPILTSTIFDADKFGFVNDKPLQNLKCKTSSLQDMPSPVESPVSISKSATEINLTLANVENSESGKALTTLALSQSLDKLKLLNEQYLATSEMHLKQWDILMRQAQTSGSPKSDQDVSLGTFGLKAQNLKKQGSSLRKMFGHEDELSDDSKSFKFLQRLIYESGIPPKHRNYLWFELSGAKNRAIAGEYQRLLANSQGTSDPTLIESIDQIKLDLHRTLPSNIYFNNQKTNGPGPQFAALKNILMAFAAYEPNIGYCQGMNKLLGNVMLGVNESHSHGGSKVSEENLFWLYVSIVEDILPCYSELNFFHPKAMMLLREDSLILRQYLNKLMPQLGKHLESLGVELELVVISWWIGVFTEAVSSIDLWLKLLDGLLIADNPRIKFHAYTLAAFYFYQRALCGFKERDSIYGFINLLKTGNGPNIKSNEFMSIAASFEKQIHTIELKSPS
ncbi:hypothetical protein PUMCH_000261 [Australozyma saopauloensis]|uniref:Rab-GAP TBC domain-containing protein n=1 Tax=Australozyma saopauloensis TaxID=291208 RepID=A0AAX4H4X7_9ASCO|nr:hypothetical protein PUMCH_000261 [[Candida] saopauloensis]